jgi:hypothetical protein
MYPDCKAFLMWNGAFGPGIAKHRDHLHASFYQHIKATGGAVATGAAVQVDRDPITEEKLDTPQEYWEVHVTMHDGSTYTFLIVSDTPGEPSEDEIEKQLTQYIRNKVPGGRLVSDYIVDIDVEEEYGTPGRNYPAIFSTSQIFAA